MVGGACGYGSMVDVKPLRARVGAVNPLLFRNGEGCGACYKVKCLDKSICSRRAVTIIVTDECPGCTKGRTQFDLSGAAFGRMAVAGEGGMLRNRGELSVLYRRCVRNVIFVYCFVVYTVCYVVCDSLSLLALLVCFNGPLLSFSVSFLALFFGTNLHKKHN